MTPPTDPATTGDNVVDIGVVGTGGAPSGDRRQHPGPGYWLRQARERRGWSQREAADMMNLSARFLVAMEDETFDKLPAAAFARGYLRAYAKLLNLSQDDIIRRYESVVGDDSDPYFKDLRTARRQPMLDFVRERPGLVLGVAGGLAAVVVLALLWAGWGVVREQGALEPTFDAIGGAAAGLAIGSDEAAAEDPARDNAGAIALPPAAAGGDLVPVDIEADVTPVAPPVPGAPVADAAAATGAALAGAPMAAGGDRLEIVVAERCWVDVRDATGAKIVSSDVAPGTPLQLTGSAPFTVVLGNAPGSRVVVNGKPADVDSNTRGRVAQLVVGP